jgi:hypothetical protein
MRWQRRSTADNQPSTSYASASNHEGRGKHILFNCCFILSFEEEKTNWDFDLKLSNLFFLL